MRHTRTATLLLTLLLTACTTTPAVPTTSERFHVLGQMDLPVGEVPQVTAQSLTVAGIQLKTTGTTITDHGGYRYINTTYQVRNASSNGTPSSTPKHNVTFLAVDTQNTLLDTAVRTMKKADGTPANPSLALQVKPSANMGALGSLKEAQSLQAFSANEVGALQGLPAIIEGVLPYGFVVDRVGGGRTLDANPGLNEYQGSVTVSVKVPLQNPIEDTPRSLVLSMVYAEDSETQVTEALEEQGVINKVGARVLAATASRTNVFSGSSYPGKTRVICQVPVSRTQKAYLVNDSIKSMVNPAFENSVFLPRDHSPTVKLGCGDVMAEGGNPERELVVQGFQTGKRVVEGGAFNRGAFRREGKTWVYTPGEGAGFKAGEEVEVTWPGVGGLPALQGRYRAAASPEGAPGFQISASYTPYEHQAFQTAVGDLNNDGHLDALVTSSISQGVGVYEPLTLLMGRGDGTFDLQTSRTTTTSPVGVTVGDFNEDGTLDVLTSHWDNSTLSVLLGHGDGTFQLHHEYNTEEYSFNLIPADVNRDGHLDILATTDSGMKVYLGNGSGELKFTSKYSSGFAYGLAIGDLNGDQILDVVYPGIYSDSLEVLLGEGDGSFQPQPNPLSGHFPFFVATGDINEDKQLDVVSVNASGGLDVFLGEGNGKLRYLKNLTLKDPTTYSVNLVDTNGDGHIDILISDAQMATFLGNGDGSFLERLHPIDASNRVMFSYFSSVGDFNGDGKMDVLSTDEDSNRVYVYLKR